MPLLVAAKAGELNGRDADSTRGAGNEYAVAGGHTGAFEIGQAVGYATGSITVLLQLPSGIIADRVGGRSVLALVVTVLPLRLPMSTGKD